MHVRDLAQHLRHTCHPVYLGHCVIVSIGITTNGSNPDVDPSRAGQRWELRASGSLVGADTVIRPCYTKWDPEPGTVVIPWRGISGPTSESLNLKVHLKHSTRGPCAHARQSVTRTRSAACYGNSAASF